MIQLPQSTISGVPTWRQSGTSDSFSDLWASFNLDTSENQGKLRLGKRIVLNTGTADVAEITGVPCSFTLCGSEVFAFAGASSVGYAFKNNGTMVGTFAKDVSANSPTKVDSTTSDSVFSNNAMYVSAKSNAAATTSFFKKIGAGAWAETALNASVLDGYPHMFCNFISRTYMTTVQSTIISWDSADTISLTGTNTLTLTVTGDFSNVITKLLPADDRIFILCVNTTGAKGHVYEWDGITATGAQFDHRLETSGALAGIMYEGVPYIVDTEAKLLAWNGGTFVEVARVNRKNNLPLYNPISLVNNRFVHPNGMTIVNGKIQVLIDNRNYDNTSSIEETIPSGIYEFDPKKPEKGLIHKESIASNKSSDTITQYGQVRIAGAGALKEMGLQSTASGANGTVYAGAGYYTDATTVKYGIFYDDRNDTLQKAGYLITSKILADDGSPNHMPGVKNAWNGFYTMYRKLLSATDLMEVKCRITEVAPVEATITWTSTTTFTTTTNISSYWTSGTGGEVEVIQGIGAGRCSHITNVSLNAGTYTVTVDAVHTSATGTSIARFQNWRKISTISGQLETYDQCGPDDISNWIQFKVWCLFTGKDEIERLFIINKNFQPAN